MDLPRNTIIVAEDEELVSVLERIHASKFKELFVVIPGGAVLGHSALNLKILKKEAEQHGKTLRVAAQDPGFQRLAQGIGIAWEGDIARFWRRVEEYLGDPRLRYATEYVEMSDIVAISPESESDWQQRENETTEPAVDLSDDKEPPVTEAAEPVFAPIEEPPQRRNLKEKEKEVGETISRLYHRMDESMKKTKKTKSSHRTKEQRSLFILGGFGIAAVVLFVLVASVVLPRADIIVTPRSEIASVEIAVVADANRSSLDVEQNVIPGQLLEVTKTARRTFPSTGAKHVEEHARGPITVYNQFSSEPQTLVKTTRFLSDSGRLFRTTETVVIPGARIEGGQIIPSSIQVEVQADEPGPDFNIEPARFTIPGFQGTPKYETFYGESKSAMTGGNVGTVRIVTQDDIEGATAIVEQEARRAAEEELNEKIPEELLLVKNARSVELASSEHSVKSDDIADQFEVAAEVRARAFVFRESDMGELVNRRLLSTITEGTKELRPESLELDIALEVINFDAGTLTMTVMAKESIAWIINNEALRQDLRGADHGSVQEVLEDHPEVTAVEVIFWPFWVSEVPNNPDRIDIEIQ